jgi:hypothetical protein
MVNGGAIDYRAPLHARRVGTRKAAALVYDGAGRLVGEAFKV